MQTEQTEHEIRCTNPRCASRRRQSNGALACRIEDHAEYVVIVWKCRRCKQGQRVPLPKR